MPSTAKQTSRRPIGLPLPLPCLARITNRSKAWKFFLGLCKRNSVLSMSRLTPPCMLFRLESLRNMIF